MHTAICESDEGLMYFVNLQYTYQYMYMYIENQERFVIFAWLEM